MFLKFVNFINECRYLLSVVIKKKKRKKNCMRERHQGTGFSRGERGGGRQASRDKSSRREEVGAQTEGKREVG